MFRLLLAALLLCTCAGLSAQVRLNEILASNATVNADNDFGEFSDWVELYNSGSSPVDLSGWHLSDSSDPLKWEFPGGTSIPAGGFLLVWADGKGTGLHTSFKFSADGEGVAIYDQNGDEVDAIAYGAQQTDISFGRQTDGSGNWGYFTKPTPGASNSTPFFEDFVYQVPIFSKSGGFFDAPVTIDIQNLYGQGELRYTTNGANPNASSPIWGQALTISANTVVKARIFLPGHIPGPIVTNTYFIGEHLQDRGLPVVSLSTHPDYFFAADSGLYVQDFKPTWEYPVHIEMYEPDGILAFHHDMGVQIGGENSWILPEKLLNLYSRKQYGNTHFEYQIFPDDSRKVFSDLILRTSGNDWSNTLFRDNLEQGLIKEEADLDIQHYRHCIVYINGAYYGIHILTEKQDADYAEIHRGIDPDSLDYIENNAEIKEGDDVAYKQMTALLSAGVQSATQYQALQDICDTRNFTDYIISEIFTANTSWGHNIALFRERTQDGRWRWFPHDYDRGFDPANVNSTGMEWATATNGQDWSNPVWGTLFLRKMLENNDFKEQYITRFADHLYVTFHPRTIENRTNRLSGSIEKEVPYHVQRWAGTMSSYGDGIPSVAFWENEVAKLKQFGTSRNAFMWTNLNSFFGLSGSAGLTVAVSDPARGYVRLHDLKIPEYPWSGQYFNNREFTLTAVPRPGFKFVQWEKTDNSGLSLLAAGSTWKYSDATTAPDAGWNQPGFNDGAWSAGPAQLGYGDNDEATTISFGGNTNNKTISYYFRQSFDVANTQNINGLTARLVADDGAVVYLNGQEIWRYNMPGGPVDFTTTAASSVAAPGENAWNEQNIPANVLVNGQNLLAVEVHQFNATSSDVSFDFELLGQVAGSATVLGTDPVLNYTLNGSAVSLRAVFESDGTCGILPDTVRQNLSLTVACSPYRAVGNVVVLPGVTLSAEPGVEIQMPEKADLWVMGNLNFSGTDNAPVKVNAVPGGSAWGGILLQNASATSVLHWVTLKDASAGQNRVYFPASISAYKSNLDLDHLDLTGVTDNPVFSRFSDVVMTNSRLKSAVTGDCINVKQGHARVEHCEFEGGSQPDMDAIDYDGVIDGIVRDNVIHDFRGDNCDGLDIGEECHNLLIEHNFIYHCFDKGISVGQQSSATIRNNTIAYTYYGIALKDRSPATVDHCTFFGTQKGVAAYEKNAGYLGGNGIISNCIASNILTASYTADGYSSLQLSNCFSDPDTVAGTNNLVGDPIFKNPTLYDFNLQTGSPCIDAGANGTNLGPDVLPHYSGQPRLMLSEILYFDTLVTTGEFLEILNPGTEAVNLEGYTLSEAVTYTFPAGAVIAPGERIVVAKDASAFNGSSFQVFEWTDGKLKDEGETILLFDASGILSDFVRYDNHAPWPERADLNGKSLELVSESLDNHFASSWKPSSAIGGTPGGAPISVGTHTPVELMQMTVFPNPAVDRIGIAMKGVQETGMQVWISDATGKVVRVDNLQQINGIAECFIATAGWSAGHYVAVVRGARGQLLGRQAFEVGSW